MVGYRTRRSMLNRETWTFAHKTAAKFWIIWGSSVSLLFLVLNAVIFFAFQGIFEFSMTAMQLLELIPVIAVIPYTESKLKTEFDDEGNRKK